MFEELEGFSESSDKEKKQEPKRIQVTVRKDDDTFETKSLNPLDIEYLRDLYYETQLYLDNGEVWCIKEDLKALGKKLDAIKSEDE